MYVLVQTIYRMFKFDTFIFLKFSTDRTELEDLKRSYLEGKIDKYLSDLTEHETRVRNLEWQIANVKPDLLPFPVKPGKFKSKEESIAYSTRKKFVNRENQIRQNRAVKEVNRLTTELEWVKRREPHTPYKNFEIKEVEELEGLEMPFLEQVEDRY